MNKEKWKAMSFKQKCQWLIQYYGIAAVAVVAGIIVVVSLLKAIFGPGENYAVNILVLDDRMTAEHLEQFRLELEEKLGDSVNISNYQPSQVYQMQAFSVRLTADDMDIIIAPEKEMNDLVEQGYAIEAARLTEDTYYMEKTREVKVEGDSEMYIAYTTKQVNPENGKLVREYLGNE